MVIETTKIKDDNRRGFKVINKCDFDAKKHKVYTVPKKPTRRKKVVKDDNN